MQTTFTFRTGVVAGALACLVVVMVGSSCTTNGDRKAESSTPSRQELATGFQTQDGRFSQPWDSPGTVNVCYIASSDAGLDTTRVSEINSALAQSWGAVTGLTFSSQGECPATVSSSWIGIFVDMDGFGGLAAMGGKGVRFGPSYSGTQWGTVFGPLLDYNTNVQIYVGTHPSVSSDGVALTAVHEMGHALGFYHEMERTDNTTGCGSSENDAGHITSFDANSIMLWSYCSTDRTGSSLLSPLDRLGAEMIYPYTFSAHKIVCAAGCFETGEGAILRADGSATIDWVRRGADIDPVWSVGTTVQNSDGRINATDLSSDSVTATAAFDDMLHRSHAATGLLTRSNSMHAAILVSIQP